jgi:hypothetical protein
MANRRHRPNQGMTVLRYQPILEKLYPLVRVLLFKAFTKCGKLP